MGKFLNDYITTLNGHKQMRASQIISDAKISKEALTILHSRLSTSVEFGNFVFNEVEANSLISGRFYTDFRDVYMYLSGLYNRCNYVRDLLVGSNAVVMSDIKRIEEEISALEKSVDNYSFLLSHSGSYDYSFIETFNNYTNRAEDIDFTIPDRANAVFYPSDNASIDSAAGVLYSADNVGVTFPFSANIFKTNSTTVLASSDSGIEKLVDNSPFTGWEVSVKSPTVISSSLEEYGDIYKFFTKDYFKGVQVILDLTLDQPAPLDMLQIEPFSAISTHVAQIYAYPNADDENNFIPILSEPITLSEKQVVSFKSQSIMKFRLFLYSGTYVRTLIPKSPAEEVWKYAALENNTAISDVLSDEKKNSVNELLPSRYDSSVEKTFILCNAIRAFLESEGTDRFKAYTVTIPSRADGVGWGPFSRDRYSMELRSAFTRNGGNTLQAVGKGSGRGVWGSSTAKKTILSKILSNSMFDQSADVIYRAAESVTAGSLGAVQGVDTEAEGAEVFYSAPRRPKEDELFDTDLNNTTSEYLYKYVLGIKNIQVGISKPRFKSVYVSKVLPIETDAGEVRLKVGEVKYMDEHSNKDEPSVTSIEYSVTNQSRPKNESDWAPILPVNNASVRAERGFVDEQGKLIFRFPAKVEEDIILYRNGYKVRYELSLIRTRNNDGVEGIRLPVGEFTPEDIFTVSYTPNSDFTVVNFESSNFTKPPLVSITGHDELPGELFDSTGGQLQVDIAYTPYVNYGEVAGTTYVSGMGHNGYSPITVRLKDGTVAVNLTNYSGGEQSTLSQMSDNYQYIQSGSRLIFNKPINQPFRIHYQHVQNNLRFRVVLRTNTDSHVTPKVDYVQLKAKTRKVDPRRVA